MEAQQLAFVIPSEAEGSAVSLSDKAKLNDQST
jgi:hypothetical protein